MELKLPTVVVTRSDVLRLYRELEALEHYFQNALKQGLEGDQVTLPKTSKSLDGFVSENNLNLFDPIVRKTLLEFIGFIKQQAPVFHISFASDPSAKVVGQIVEWLRREVHPRIILQIGVQPNLAGGCLIRTRNRVFDFSLGRHFSDNRHHLTELLDKAVYGSNNSDHTTSPKEAVAVASEDDNER